MSIIFVNRRQVFSLAAMPLSNGPYVSKGRTSRAHPILARGINFHHLLNWPTVQTSSNGPNYSWPAFADERYKLRADDVAIIRSLGFDFVRLTVDPGIWIAESPRHRGELERHYFDCVETLLAAGLNVVFDLAPVDNHPAYAPMRLLAPESPQNLIAYSNMLAQMAKLLSRGPTDRIALEIFNEPPLSSEAGEIRWAATQILLHTRARDVAPDLPLVVTPARWGHWTALTRLDSSPYAGSNVIYTFHYYDPHLFTHQGTKTGAISYISGVDWPLTLKQARQAENDAEIAVASDTDLGDEAQTRLRDQIRDAFAVESAKLHDEAMVARDFGAVAAWANAKGIAPNRILLGEFGCVLASRGRPTGEARLRWLAAVRRAAETQGFGWAYWAFKGYGGMELVDRQGALHADLIEPLGLNSPH